MELQRGTAERLFLVVFRNMLKNRPGNRHVIRDAGWNYELAITKRPSNLAGSLRETIMAAKQQGQLTITTAFFLLLVGSTDAQEKAKLPPPTKADVKYGPHPNKNLFDFWQAESKEPTPALISIHGGGFSQGVKTVRADILDDCLKAGISVFAINYRLTEQAMAPAQFLDSARALQFIRHHAKEFNIDPARIALSGGSAGGGISLWIAFHDDLADPKNDDPVLRQSTRVKCVVASAAQTSYDPHFIKKLFPDNDVHKIPNIGYLVRAKPEELESLSAEKQKILEDVSPINHLTKDDPPVMLSYYFGLDAKVAHAGIGIHHPRFGEALKKKMDELGVLCELEAGGKRAGGGEPVKVIDFLKQNLK